MSHVKMQTVVCFHVNNEHITLCMCAVPLYLGLMNACELSLLKILQQMVNVRFGRL